MGKFLFAVAFVLLATPLSAQTSPCSAPAQTTVQITSAARNALVLTQPEFNGTLNNLPILTDVDVAAFAKGSDPATAQPVAAAQFAKSALTVVDAVTNCYRLVVPFIALVAPNVEYDLRVRNRGNVFDANGVASLQWGAWSSVRVPFGRSAVAVAPTGLWIP